MIAKPALQRILGRIFQTWKIGEKNKGDITVVKQMRISKTPDAT